MHSIALLSTIIARDAPIVSVVSANTNTYIFYLRNTTKKYLGINMKINSS